MISESIKYLLHNLKVLSQVMCQQYHYKHGITIQGTSKAAAQITKLKSQQKLST